MKVTKTNETSGTAPLKMKTVFLIQSANGWLFTLLVTVLLMMKVHAVTELSLLLPSGITNTNNENMKASTVTSFCHRTRSMLPGLLRRSWVEKLHRSTHLYLVWIEQMSNFYRYSWGLLHSTIMTLCIEDITKTRRCQSNLLAIILCNNLIHGKHS